MSGVSTLVKTVLVCLVLAIEAVNRRGLKAGGTWYDYGTTFEGEKLTAEAVGRTAKLTLVEAKDGKKYVRSIELRAAAPKPAAAQRELDSVASVPVEESAPVRADGPSLRALAYGQDLVQKAGLSTEELAEIVRLRFKKELGEIDKGEFSLLITFLGGYQPERKRSR